MTNPPPRGGRRPGAGRKPTGHPMVMFHIRVPADLKERLSKLPPDIIRKALAEIAPE